MGDANDDYRNQLTVIISNKANYVATIVIYPVKVILLAIYLEQIQTETSYTCYKHVLVTITKSLVWNLLWMRQESLITFWFNQLLMGTMGRK